MMSENLPDEKTKPEVPVKSEEQKQPILVIDPHEEMIKLIPTAGTIKLTEKQRETLYAPVDQEKVEIRPDGLIYLPWMEYISRLKVAFDLEWAPIPQGLPKMQGEYMYWPFWLVIQGKLAGFAIGEQRYIPSNRQMTYGDACEGAKSNALMRLCKGLGITLELWQPSFIRAWKEKYAETYQEEGKTLWRKKSANGKKEKTKNFDFLKQMKKAKETIGDEAYYGIL